MGEIGKDEFAVVLKPTGLVDGQYTTVSVYLMAHDDSTLDESNFNRLFHAGSLMATFLELVEEHPALMRLAVEKRDEIAQSDFLDTDMLTPFSKTYGSA
jgi:hypothetical protein